MNERKDAHDRQALLAFVERHWRELTLEDARALRVEALTSEPPAAPLLLNLP